MKEYLVCANFSCTDGTDIEHKFILKANDIAGAAVDADRILDDSKSRLDFVTEVSVKYLREITE